MNKYFFIDRNFRNRLDLNTVFDYSQIIKE